MYCNCPDQDQGICEETIIEKTCLTRNKVSERKTITMKHSDKNVKSAPTSWGSPFNLACTAIALVLGLIVGWLDLHITEVIITIIGLFTAGLVLGLLQPAAAWRWPVLVVIGLPLMVVIAHMSHMQTAEPAQLDIGVALVALLFVFAGTYAGVFIRYAIRT